MSEGCLHRADDGKRHHILSLPGSPSHHESRGRSVGATRTLDSHACRLRQKLGTTGDRFGVNVWGVGYRLVDGPVEVPA